MLVFFDNKISQVQAPRSATLEVQHWLVKATVGSYNLFNVSIKSEFNGLFYILTYISHSKIAKHYPEASTKVFQAHLYYKWSCSSILKQ